jgi:4-hydroxymandelate oxidase
LDIAALEEAARAAADPLAWAYIAGGAGDEITVAENLAAWRRWRLRPHMLRDVSYVSTQTEVLGTSVPFPILVAPTAMHGLFSPDRELATAIGAARAGALYVVSQVATTALEDIAKAALDGHRWMQLYVQRDRGLTRAVCERAADAGYRALVVTVDSPVMMRRTRQVDRGTFGVPPGMQLPNLAPGVESPDLFALVEGYDPTLQPEDLATLSEWAGGLPVLAKGIVRGAAAARCVEAGAAGIVVSNHGGRQLDTCMATGDVLAEIVEAVDGRGEVYVDGGIRRGTDVLKALALGATAVLVGRPVVWGLAAAGADGVCDVLTTLADELATAMGLAGVTDARMVPRDLVTRVG